MRQSMVLPILRGLVAVVASCVLSGAVHAEPSRVTFASADGQTTLVGYLFEPASKGGARRPAVVMMHGRAGAYSSLAHDVFDASTLSRRHRAWGERWAEQGYVALLVDGFGPRGYPQGFGRHSYDQRPPELNEVTVRPLDAYGALAYLRSRPDIAADRIGLMGWSNGGSAGLATVAVEAPGIVHPTPETGFRAALIFYPACALKGAFAERGYRPYAPVRVFHGTADEEVSFSRCVDLVSRSREIGGNISITIYPGATHDFDDPSRTHQKMPANAAATEEAIMRSLRFFAAELAGR
jgi:carboxymethylenebutenolidase